MLQIGQWWNGAAVFTVLRYAIFRPSLLKPEWSVKTLAEADWSKMRRDHRIKFVVFDKDNTLTAPYSNKIHPEVAQSFDDCKALFNAENIAILSNSAGTKDDAGYSSKEKIEGGLGVDVITHTDKKPLGFNSVLHHFRRKGQKIESVSEILIVGDRLMTDVLLGRLNGAHTLHCSQPLSTKEDNPMVRILRWVENRIILKLLTR